MVGRVLTSSNSITRGLVSARYALNLRDIPRFPTAGEALRGVSVVLTLAVTLFFAGVVKAGFPRWRHPGSASRYHTVACPTPWHPELSFVSESSPALCRCRDS